jgi:hypothetical protein
VTIQVLRRRFDELLVQLEAVERTKKFESGTLVSGDFVDDNLLLGWRVKAYNLLAKACGLESEHYRRFESVENKNLYLTNYQVMLRQKAVFLAAKEDHEGGYLRSIRSLVHADLFNDELEQARELLTSGYRSAAAAAVIARVVLETTLRKLCGDKGISLGKLDKMNADLAKAGVYDVLVQKRVTMLADVGNKAACGFRHHRPPIPI